MVRVVPDEDVATGQYDEPTRSGVELAGRDVDRDGRPHVRRERERGVRGSGRAAHRTSEVNGTVEPQGELRNTAAEAIPAPAVLHRQVREFEVARQQRLHQEGRHLLPGHWVAGAEVAASAAAGDAEAHQLLDVRAERAAGRHVVEHLGTRHTGGRLGKIQGLGQS